MRGLLMAGVAMGGFWARVFVAPETVGAFLAVSLVGWALFEAVMYLARHLRWEREGR